MKCIETSRLLLREWEEEDLPLFVRMNQDPEVMEYFPKILTEEESVEFYRRIRKEFEEYSYGLYAVEVKGGSRFIGYIGLHRATFEADFTPCVEIGWRLCREAWGKGYATEGALACMREAFRHFRLPEIYSFTTLPNKRSERVMQKIGMQKTGEFDHPLVPAAHPLLRHVLYRLQADGTAEGRIFPASSARHAELTGLWECSVRATHTFLTEQDILKLRPVVSRAMQEIEMLFYIPDDMGKAVAFMGVEENKLEMLFVDPWARGKGYGRLLVNYAVDQLEVCYVDVNEQNPAAMGFYEHLGFRVFDRSLRDAQGNAFPVLHMENHKRK